jgi:hypothetical protein
LQGLLWGLLVVGGLIALGLGASVALLSRSGGHEQVVVVGGENRDTPPPSAPSGGPRAPSATAETTQRPKVSEVATSPAEEVTANRPQSEQSRTGSEANVGAKPTAKDRQARLSRAVQQRSGEFQSCFAKHIQEGKDAPEAVLHFSVAKEGGRAQVEVEPSALAATPLGGCLQAAAVRVQFPELDQPVSFRLPVRARITHTTGPG